MPTLVLIDGNSIAYRAFYALPEDLATKSGQITNAVFGFTRMLIRLLKDYDPDGIAVAWDVSRKTFRTEAAKTLLALTQDASQVDALVDGGAQAHAVATALARTREGARDGLAALANALARANAKGERVRQRS